MTALTIIENVLAGQVELGFQTHSLADGADFIWQFEGVNVLTINPDSE